MDISELKESTWYESEHRTRDGRVCVWSSRYYTIYSLINLDNGKRYIGRTRNPRQRIKTHLQGIKSGKHINRLINADANCRFTFEILEERVEPEKRVDTEISYMVKYRTYDERFGYNANDPIVKRIERMNRCEAR